MHVHLTLLLKSRGQAKNFSMLAVTRDFTFLRLRARSTLFHSIYVPAVSPFPKSCGQTVRFFKDVVPRDFIYFNQRS